VDMRAVRGSAVREAFLEAESRRILSPGDSVTPGPSSYASGGVVSDYVAPELSVVTTGGAGSGSSGPVTSNVGGGPGPSRGGPKRLIGTPIGDSGRVYRSISGQVAEAPLTQVRIAEINPAMWFAKGPVVSGVIAPRGLPCRLTSQTPA